MDELTERMTDAVRNLADLATERTGTERNRLVEKAHAVQTVSKLWSLIRTQKYPSREAELAVLRGEVHHLLRNATAGEREGLLLVLDYLRAEVSA